MQTKSPTPTQYFSILQTDSRAVSQVCTKYYVVKENASSAITGITYDTAEYYITVTVTDGGKGSLVADVNIEHSADGETDKIVFTNVYEMIPENPPTGDICGMSMLFALVLLSGGGAIAMLLKKKREE